MGSIDAGGDEEGRQDNRISGRVLQLPKSWGVLYCVAELRLRWDEPSYGGRGVGIGVGVGVCH